MPGEAAPSSKSISGWRDALASLAGFRAPELVSHLPPRSRVPCHGGDVLVTLTDPGAAEAGVALELPGARERWPELTILPLAQALSHVGRHFTGDDAFDGAVAVFALGAPTEGAFDDATRTRIRALVADGVVVCGGVVSLGAERALAVPDAAKRPLLESMLALAQRLAHPDEPPLIPKDRDVERDAQRPPAATSFNLLSRQLRDASLPDELRSAALQRLIAHHPLERITELEPVPWRQLENSATLQAVEEALGKSSETTGHGVLILLQNMLGPLRHARLTLPLAEALGAALARGATYEGRRALLELTAHANPKIARIGGEHFDESFPDLAVLAATFDDSRSLGELALSPNAVNVVLRRIAARFSLPASDAGRPAALAEEAAARSLVRRLTARLDPLAGTPMPPPLPSRVRDPLAAFAWSDLDWPDPHIVLPIIASHRRAGDTAGVGFLEMLVGDDDASVRRAALAALMDLPLSSGDLPLPVTSPEDVLAAAVDGSPRHAARFLVRAYERLGQDTQRLDNLKVLAKIGTSAEVPFLGSLLDEKSDAIVFAALAALGALAERSDIPRIEPYASGVFRARDVKFAARSAIEQIRARPISATHARPTTGTHARPAVTAPPVKPDDEPPA